MARAGRTWRWRARRGLTLLPWKDPVLIAGTIFALYGRFDDAEKALASVSWGVVLGCALQLQQAQLAAPAVYGVWSNWV